MIREAGRFIDRLPLAGKYTLGPTLKGYIRSDLGQEKRKFAGASALLGAFVVMHACQAKLGVDAFSEQLQHFETTGDVRDTFFMGIDAAYASVNTAATLRQASLLHTANQIRQKRHARGEKTRALLLEKGRTLDLRLSDEAPQESLSGKDTKASAAPAQPEASYTENKNTNPKVPVYKRKLSALGLAFTVTLGGQAAMLVSWGDAASDHKQDTCIREANASISAQEYLGNITTSSLEAFRDEWINYCGVSPSDVAPLFPQSQHARP